MRPSADNEEDRGHGESSSHAADAIVGTNLISKLETFSGEWRAMEAARDRGRPPALEPRHGVPAGDLELQVQPEQRSSQKDR